MKKFLVFAFLVFAVAVPVTGQAKPPAESVAITEQTQLDFAQLSIPTAGSENIIINPSTGGFSGTGSVQIGTPTRGKYKLRLSGSGSSTSATIDIQNISSGSSAVTISNFTGYYGGSSIGSLPQSGLSKPLIGVGTTLYLGATATYTSSVPATTLVPTFDIVVTLQ